MIKLSNTNLSSKVREAILDLINNSDFMSKLPSENELATQMGISRNTVREVLKALENEGLVISRHGIGTFVTKYNGSNNIQYNISSLDSTTVIIEKHGFKSGTKGVYFDTQISSKEVSNKLGSNSLKKVLYIERVRTADEEPIVFVEDYIAYDEGMYEDFVVNPTVSLFKFLENYTPVSFSSCSIHAVLSNEKLMDRLELKDPKALLLLQQIHYSTKGIPVFYSDSYFITEKLEFNVIRRFVG